MRKFLSTGINKIKSFAILSRFQIMGIIFFILSLPCVSLSQQTEKLSTIEGQLIRSIPSLKNFKPGLISPQTSLSKKKEIPSLGNSSSRLIDHGTKAKGDPIVQRVSSTAKLSSQEANSLASIPSTIDKNFDGQGFTSVSPASPSIAAGPDHVLQMINGPTGSHFKIWDRDGNVVINQTILSSLFGGGDYSGVAEPVAIYDQFADRYMMTELGTVGGSILVNTLVIAISQTNDPTGGWNLYKFTDNSFYHSSPHFAAWPNVLYASTNDFLYNGSYFTSYLGTSLYAIDKNQMVAGNLTVTLLRYRLMTANKDDICPVNISGSTPPASGSPGIFMYISDDNFTSSATDVDSVGFISLQPDFATPANSVISFFQQIAVAPFKSGLCNYDPNCIPAPGGRYESVSDRFMRNIYYRNFGTHESIVANHTVDANYPNLPQKAGVRWYEFRRTGGDWSTYQQSTYSPDAQSRWMGSIGINSKGQIALSYNLASSTRFGSFYFTGRNADDALNQMSIADNAIINGSGYGTFANRWGAYNDMATDVVNDSLFWTTAMYGFTINTWKTRVAAVKIGDVPVALPTPPLVTINQATGQSDPTSASPIHFTVTFDQEVTGFTSSDISFTGSTPFMLLVANVTVTGGPIVYDVAVSGMTSSGTVIATVPAGSALNAASQSNSASTSTDNSVIYNIPPCTITCPSNITVAATSLSGAVVNYNVTPAGDCQNIVRVPVSGTIFPIGTTTVNAYNNVSTGLVYGLSHTTDFLTGFPIDELVTFNVNTAGPTTLSTPITITGASFTMVAIDFRPSNGQLYGLEVAWFSTYYGGKIYTINKNTGVATPLTLDYFDLSDAGSFDIDFDPVTDILRVTDAKGTNLRIDPDLGTVIASDPALSTGITATAYSNTFASSTFTTLYEINSVTNALYIQGGINGVPSPNTGSSTLVGPLGIDVEEGNFTGIGGFDISLSAGALATFVVDGAYKLYSINLSTGAATLIGTFNGSVIDIAIAPVTLPAASCSFTVTVTPIAPAVTINKASTQADPTSIVPIHFTVVFDQDVTGFDASDISFAGSTAQGSLVATISGTGPTYDVSVSGITGPGDVIAGINAGAAQNNSGQACQVSTSDDNVITVTQILEPPQITCPGNIVLNIEPGKCDARVSFTGENEVIVTGTSVYSLSYSINSENGSLNGTGNLSSYSLPVGVNTVNITAANDAGSSSCSFTVTVVDDQPPVLNCSSDITVNAQAGQCSAMVTYNIVGSENCMDAQHPLTIQTSTGAIFNLSGPQSLSISQTFQVGTIRINVFATDAAGNTATCSFNVTVVDNQKPVINCPSSVTVSCASEIPVPNISAASASDNCGTTTITHVGDVITNQACANKYTLTRTYKATDGYGNTATCSQLITVDDNTPPQITGLTSSKQVLWPANHKMVDVMLNYTVNDNCVSTPNVNISITSNEPENGTGDGDTGTDWEIIDDHHIRIRAERAANGTGRIYTITVRVSDGCNASVSATTQVMVVHNITAPHSGNSFKVGSTVAFSGEFWDKPGNKHTAKWQIDGSTTSGAVTEPSGNKNGKVTGSYKFNTPGVYKLQMNITDQAGVTSYANTNGDLEAIIVIYDPNGGHTYGGGYYDSRAGALVSNPSSTGKASYGFAMNYFKNSTNPKGETQFEFKVGEFEFNALNFEYLVISNSMAQFKGTGKIIGGQSGVAFTMTVTDGQLDGSGIDKIRMKIYNKNNGKISYDNQPGASDAALPTQAVGANSLIVISGINSSLTSVNTNQKAEMEATETKAVNGLNVIAYPNPSINNFSITVQASAKEKITMQVVDMYGRVIETRNVSTNSIVRFGDRYRPGTYFVRVIQGKQHKELKLVKLSD